MKNIIYLSLVGVLFNFNIFATSESLYNSDHSGFEVKINNIVNKYNVLGIYIMPSQNIEIKCAKNMVLTAKFGSLNQKNGMFWTWKAPIKRGLYKIDIKLADSQKSMALNVFVLRPASELKNLKMDGYRIGQYPAALRGLKSYQAPKGYIEVTDLNKHTKISPHFTLGQFICKQYSKTSSKYIVLNEQLLLKLETILEELNNRNISTSSLVIMSGYRTPFYNKAIGSKKYSRHMYGGAADIYVDVNPKDGVMDDLNSDGIINKKDAAVLYSIIEKLSQKKHWTLGGLGEYKATHAHGPFVHVDVRGTRARWGH